MNDIETIKEIYRRYWKCMIDKDESELRSLMSDDYYLMHITGTRQSIDEFISGLLDGTFNYYSAEHDDIQISENGNTATMVGKSKVLAAVYGGGKSRWRLRGDFTLRKENENWKLTSSKASTY